ncbi:MAG: hypothetical protein IPP49_00395 [Saprospiraceae bacterium]|nr:hypothetical protein [Saprospiraceae bacterium]
MTTTDGYSDKKVIGLFDYDKEGCENFYHLKKHSEKEWDDQIFGEKSTGYYRKRKNHPCFYGVLLPIPLRLDGLTSDIKDAQFTSFVEIENLINQDRLIELGCVDEKKF